MDMKKLLILGLSVVVLLLAVFILMSKEAPKQEVPAGRLVMTTSAIEVVEGVPNSARVYFKNIGSDVKEVRVYIEKPTTCDGECDAPSRYFDASPMSGTLYMDDALITDEEDSFRFTITPWGVDPFTLGLRVEYKECDTCEYKTQKFSLPVRVTDGLVLLTEQVPFVVDERNTISLRFKNVGRTEIRNIRVRVYGERTGFAFTEKCFSAEAGFDSEQSIVLGSGEEATVEFDVTSDKKPEYLRVEVTYNFLDREYTRTYEIPVV